MDAHDDRPSSGTPDLVFAMAVGFLACGVRPYYAAVLAFTGRAASAVALFGSVAESRMVVWAICAVLPVLYFTFMAAQGVLGRRGGPVPKMLPETWRQRPVPAGEGAGLFASQGAKGGVIGVLVLAPLFGVALLLCALMMLVGPPPAIILLPVLAAVACFLGAAGWGAALGTLIYVRRTFGWPAGIATGGVLILLVNLLVEHWLM